VSTNKELLEIRESETPRGVGIQTSVFADKARNAELWDVEGNRYIDLAAGIAVLNTPEGNSVTTAEHAIALLVSLARHIPQATSSTRAGKWEKARFMGVELTGKMLGLIGAGNIGSIVASKALGYGLKVQAYDPFLTDERAARLGVRKVDLDTLLGSSDIVSLHVPKTPETTNIISASALNKMKPGSMLINCARGGLVDELALVAALQSGHLRGAALDVFEVEPARENPLFELDNVICTPHLGASTIEAQEKVAIQVTEQVILALQGQPVSTPVNSLANRLYWPKRYPISRPPTPMSPAGTSVLGPMWRCSSVMKLWQNRMTSLSLLPLGSKSEPPLPPPIGNVVRPFLKTCSKPRNFRMPRFTVGWKRRPPL